MKIHQLRALVAIADAGSIRGAARLLNSSPAAITQSLQQIEGDLKLHLVTRTPSGVTLTPHGRALLEHARLIVGQLARAHQAVDEIRGETGGRLSIAVTAWVAMTFLPEAVIRFRQRMTNVQLEVFEGLLAIANPRLRDGSLDIYIGRQTPGNSTSEFTYRPLFSSTRAVVARQGHPRAESRTLAELLDLDWLVALDPETEGLASYKMFAQHHLPVPRSIHYLHSLTVAVALLQRTDMVSIFPWPLVELCASHESLCAIPVREQLDESLVGIMTRAGEPLREAASCFIECLVETIRDETAAGGSDRRRVMNSVEILV
ncbi:LysR family transcriptional regulator [Paraburkholderia sp. LEh10]|uniref:LysR substrate-binding domain-containing protein n=1 Tax=Paraburkholderia sp. LEh10 TaxID=2821353 RepID=UPI001AE9BE2B|nr:LysR substrate-binding domain-containing protein [Paraburkholderia sp. LEh10]MBP0589969.1 LysR family transcriptional regulator [Paraburkholderia sp. LEh10]